MFERYTESARRTIFFGRYEASQFGSPYIETEHLLLGVLREDKALTNRFLRGHAQVESIRKQIEEATMIREKVSTSVDLPLSNECKRVLAYAAEEAERLSHKHIGTEHLLLGLLREEKSFAAQILNERGVRLSSVRKELSETQEEPAGPAFGREPSPLLAQFTLNLTQLAEENKLLPLIGREDELERIAQALGRSRKNNVVLVGEPGVGKRTIVEGLAQSVAEDKAPRSVSSRLILAIDLSLVVAGAQHSARRREFLKAIGAELTERNPNTIFFFDELHALLGGDSTGGMYEIETVLKPALLSGKVQCIAAATLQEYDSAIKNSRWLERCFRVVEVKPASEAETLKVLLGIKDRFEKFHSVQYTEDALEAAVACSNRHVKDRHLPDKAIDLIDDAGAYVKLKYEKVALPEDVIEARKRLKFIAKREEDAVSNHEYEKARFYSDEKRKQQENLNELHLKHNIKGVSVGTVTREHVEEVLARWTGVPVASIRQGPSSPHIDTQDRSRVRRRPKRNKGRKSPSSRRSGVPAREGSHVKHDHLSAKIRFYLRQRSHDCISRLQG